MSDPPAILRKKILRLCRFLTFFGHFVMVDNFLVYGKLFCVWQTLTVSDFGG